MQPLKFPYPYRAWITISNDPDNTDLNAWHQLDELIFKLLDIPWANSLFVFSHNLNLPDQVSLARHPEIAAQPVDTLHTWGDFVHAGQKGFSRVDAEEAMMLLKQHGIKPRVWVDHAWFPGNLLHGSGLGHTPEHKDASGVTYTVHEYTLDLIRETGISYVWDGQLTQVIGQDRRLHWKEWLEQLKKKLYLPAFWKQKWGTRGDNTLLRAHAFNDGNQLYTFSRYGKWRHADIDNFHQVINDKVMDTLEKNGGAMIVYTHLGKSRTQPYQLPEEAANVFREIRERMDQKRIFFSSLSRLLDYTVIRNNIRIEPAAIHFQPDGIRYKEIEAEELKPYIFSFCGVGVNREVRFFAGNRELEVSKHQETKDVVSIQIIGWKDHSA